MRYVKSSRILFLFIIFSVPLSAKTPLLPGDHPDPSVLKLNDDWWAVTTSSEWAPLFPIHHSKDGEHWETLGAVFQNRPSWAEAYFWAPELYYNGKQFFVYYAARKTKGSLCVAVATANKLMGPYEDHGPF